MPRFVLQKYPRIYAIQLDNLSAYIYFALCAYVCAPIDFLWKTPSRLAFCMLFWASIYTWYLVCIHSRCQPISFFREKKIKIRNGWIKTDLYLSVWRKRASSATFICFTSFLLNFFFAYERRTKSTSFASRAHRHAQQ